MSELTIKENLAVEIACLFFGYAPHEYWKTALAIQHPEALKQAMQLIDSAITEARIQEWQSLEVHPNDAEIYLADSELAWYKASEAIRIRIAQLKNNTTKQEDIKDE